MVIYCCDLCKQPLGSEWYEDENGKRWDTISFRQKKYKRKMFCFDDSWTEYLTICGRCRAELAKRGIGEEVQNASR